MRKFLVWTDGVRRELSPLSYREFERLGLYQKEGDTEQAFNRWLRHNDLHDPIDFNEDALVTARLELCTEPRTYAFSATEDVWCETSSWSSAAEAHQTCASDAPREALILAMAYKRVESQANFIDALEAYGNFSFSTS